MTKEALVPPILGNREEVHEGEKARMTPPISQGEQQEARASLSQMDQGEIQKEEEALKEKKQPKMYLESRGEKFFDEQFPTLSLDT